MNEADSRHLASQLEVLGYSHAAVAEDADLVILNTCVVRQQAEDKIYGRLGALQRAKRERPDMMIGLMGCFVGVKEAPSLRKRFPFVDVFMPPSDPGPLMAHLGVRTLADQAKVSEAKERALRDAIQDEAFNLPSALRGRAVTAHVPIVLGCSHGCTFCIIPYRRGAERSRRPGDILREIGTLVDQGVREVMLLGQIVDRYGTDLEGGPDLADLLRAVAEVEGLLRVRFLTSHPNWMTDKLLDTVASIGKICPHIEVPVQAGNDEVLRRMRRDYTVDGYRRLVDRIRERIPDVAVNTDIIVGFPGETKEQFMDTYRLVEELRFDKVHLAKYSERPKTVAARTMPDDVPHPEKERRRMMIDELQAGLLEEKNAAYQGGLVEVLVEERQKGRWKGRTPDNRLVFFDHDGDVRGKLVRIAIDWTSPYTLIGHLKSRGHELPHASLADR